jgi:hypothetical protein
MADRAPLFPDPVWDRLRAMLAEIRVARRSCKVVMILNCKQGEPVDGDVLATEPPSVVPSR